MRFLKSFVYAWNGLKYSLLAERNFKIHLTITVMVIVSGIGFKISSTEWIAVFVCIALVLSMEMLNTVIEKLCDVVHPAESHQIKIIKDISAAAVLVGAIASVIIAFIIFLPKIIALNLFK